MRTRAFTLIELLLVLGLLAVILAFAFPDYGKIMRSKSLDESADRLKTLVLMSHAKAMQEGRKYIVYFPGTPDPLDRFAEKEIDIPFETLQPIVERQVDPLVNPHWFGGFDEEWKLDKILQDGTRCVAVLPGRPNFEIRPESPIAGPSINEGQAEFVRLSLNADGTCDWVTFVLTDLPIDTEITAEHASHIYNVIVDGRTGQTWVQRALSVEEVEFLQENGMSPTLYQDFTSAVEIKEENTILSKLGGVVKTGGSGTD
jgi:prepilin-type N-terminal cleavage/methylation domain-containing protein